MIPRAFTCIVLPALLFSAFWMPVSFSRAADWPAYRGNSERTAKTSEKLSFPLTPVWKYVPANKPKPAWTDPFMAVAAGYDFDYAPQVVIVGKTMYFGSTTDNTMWALDAATGETKWGFTTGGPIRFAPAIWEGYAYVVSDDGHVYCVDAATGKLSWKFYGGPYDSRVFANGRMASRWLIRSAVVVDDGMVNFASGMFGSEGVYAYGLDAKTGKKIWRNDTNYKFVSGPHGSDNYTDNMPQGYAAASKKKLLFSNGQAGAYVYDRQTGVVTQHIDSRSEVRKGGRGDGAVLLINKDGTIEHPGSAATDAKIKQNWVVASDTIIKCEKNKITANYVDSTDGKIVWEHTMESTIMGVAVANGMLVVSTTDGGIHCFKSGQRGKTVTVGPGTKEWPKTSPGPAADILNKCKNHKISKGYALVLGEPDAKLAEALAANTELQVICALTDQDKVNAERIRLRETTNLYGVRVTVEHLANTKKLPFPQYFANLVVVSDMPSGLPIDEIKRIQRPCGGLVIAGGKVSVRGKLAGARDFGEDQKITSDQRVKWPLEILWFGEPGPSNTGGKGAPPAIPVNGLAVYQGYEIVVVDAYNGTECWRWKPEGSVRYKVSAHADGKYVYCSTRRGLTVLDLKTGTPVTGVTSPTPTRPGRYRSMEDLKRYKSPAPHPVTGSLVSKGYWRSHGCRGVGTSAAMDFFRSGSLGFFDYDDNSGIRNLNGMRPGCRSTSGAGLGLFLVSDGQGAPWKGKPWGGGCDCRYPFLGALAMVPVQQQRNEGWAAYADMFSNYVVGPVRHLHMNFGAPGDRRHAGTDLWFAIPRQQETYLSMAIPYIAEFHGEKQTYRRNADWLSIDGTDQPWVYTSGFRGLKSLSLALDHYDWRNHYLGLPCEVAPKIDGALTDACWREAGETFLDLKPGVKLRKGSYQMTKETGAAYYFRHDKDYLYVAHRRAASKNPWKANTQGKDAHVWEDDCMQLLLSSNGVASEKVAYFGVSASKAMCDGLMKRVTGKGKARTLVYDFAPSWESGWQSTCVVKKEGLSFEARIPWKALKELGIDRSSFHIDFKVATGPKGPTSLHYTAMRTKVLVSNRPPVPQPYTVRLHFADLENDAPGKRVFDVKLQGKVVLKDFDIVANSGAKNKALVKEFTGIMANGVLKLEIASSAGDMTGPAAPVISGIQVVAEKEPGPLQKPLLGRITTVHRGGRAAFRWESEIENISEKDRLKGAGAGVDRWLPEQEAKLRDRMRRRGQLPEEEQEGK